MDSFSYDFSSKVTLGWHLCPGAQVREQGPCLRAQLVFGVCPHSSPEGQVPCRGAGSAPRLAVPGAEGSQLALGLSGAALPCAQAEGPPVL